MIPKIILGLVITILIVIISIAVYKPMAHRYKRLADQYAIPNIPTTVELITEEDLQHLPIPVQQYLEYVGVIGTPKVYDYHITFSGNFKMSETQDFAAFKAEQISYSTDISRFFYMTLSYKGITFAGLHEFKDGTAEMRIRLLDVFQIVKNTGEQMNQAETVTIFNDMVIMAPATLMDSRITWETISDTEVIGTFTNEGITISARLIFNDDHQLVNFISDDRYVATSDGENVLVTWSTPITEYKEQNGLLLPYKGSAIWHYDDHDFEYIKLVLETVEYNKNIEE